MDWLRFGFLHPRVHEATACQFKTLRILQHELPHGLSPLSAKELREVVLVGLPATVLRITAREARRMSHGHPLIESSCTSEPGLG
jgi:hypothetical protein